MFLHFKNDLLEQNYVGWLWLRKMIIFLNLMLHEQEYMTFCKEVQSSPNMGPLMVEPFYLSL